MAKVLVSASSMPAGRNMSSQLDYIKRVQTYGADMYHLDIMDGIFVRNCTIDYTYVKELKSNSALFLEAHFMVQNPENVYKKYIRAGVNSLIFHPETIKDEKTLRDMIHFIHKNNLSVGLCIDLDKDLDIVTPYIDEIDLVLVMSVKAGAGGQDFEPDAIKKIKKLRKMNDKILISVDGGINDTNADKCIKAGADILVSGSYLYDNDTYEAIKKLKGVK